MTTVLEILKITIPALIVFGTVYVMLKKYFDSQTELKHLELNREFHSEKLPIKLQAYERLIVFCDRISPQSLIFRLNQKEMTVGGLKTALLLAIQQEYEHNMAQQIYVSEKLWQIISFAKGEVQNLVRKAAEDLDANAPAIKLTEAISKLQGVTGFAPYENAKLAIKEEVKSIL